MLTFVMFLVSVPGKEDYKIKEEIMASFYAEMDDVPKVAPMMENSPGFAVWPLKHFILRKTLGERDKKRDKEMLKTLAIRLFESGSTPEFISKVLNLSPEKVNDIIENYLKKGNGKKNNGKKASS